MSFYLRLSYKGKGRNERPGLNLSGLVAVQDGKFSTIFASCVVVDSGDGAFTWDTHCKMLLEDE